MGKPTPGRPPVLPAGGSISHAATVHTSPCEGLLPECLKGPRPTPRPLGQDRELHRGAAQGRAMAPLVCHGLPPAPAGPRPGDVGTGPWLSLRAWFLPRGFGEHRAVPECSWSRLRRKLALSFSLELCPNSSLFQSRPPQRHLAPGNGNRRVGMDNPLEEARGRACPPGARMAPSTRFLSFSGPLVPLGALSCLLRSQACGSGGPRSASRALALSLSSGKKGNVSEPHADQRPLRSLVSGNGAWGSRPQIRKAASRPAGQHHGAAEPTALPSLCPRT